MVSEENVHRFVRMEIDKAIVNDFQSLRSIPSTGTWKAIDYVSTLGQSDRNELFNAFADNALFCFFPARNADLHAFKSGNEAYRRFLEAMPMIPDWDYMYFGVRDLRALLADRRSAQPLDISLALPDEVIRRAEAIVPTSAPQIRKVIKGAFSDRFHAAAENRGGGDWIYHCSRSGRAFDVRIDYRGKGDQLRYEVSYGGPAAGIEARSMTYEGMLGMGLGRWDYVTAEGLTEAVTILCQLVEELVVIPDRLQP